MKTEYETIYFWTHATQWQQIFEKKKIVIFVVVAVVKLKQQHTDNELRMRWYMFAKFARMNLFDSV